MLEVLVYSGLLGGLVLLEDGRHTALGGGGFAMHGLVEGGITGVVLLFEGNWRHVGRIELIQLFSESEEEGRADVESRKSERETLK
jgi:hypothetical protein